MPCHKLFRGRRDLLVIGAVADKNHNTVAWAMKRLAEQAAPGLRAHNLLLSCLVLAALVSIAGTLATGLSLARGISQIKSGLASLEQDFDFHLPARSDELDGIIRSINRMAAVRRKLEAELRREDRLRAVGRLTAGIAHEIRNPLNSIALTIQVLERKAQTESIRREDLRTVRSEISRLNTLLGDLLNFQRVRQPQRRVQSILPIVEHCISLVQKQAEIQTTQILLEPAHPGTCALCDSEQLTQTLVNLLLNAVESSPPGASVRVSIHQLSGRTFIDIDDKGPGLDAEQREHLFEPFYTTKATGSGLGLAVSRELMRNQGADLLYASTSAGTRFTVDLPGN